MPVSDLASEILDPILRKRAGISIGLVQSWEEIAGPRLASHTRPEKIVWPRRMQEDDPFQPATLIIACEGFAALHVQHETGEIIGRINSFLGFNADRPHQDRAEAGASEAATAKAAAAAAFGRRGRPASPVS